MDDPSAFRRFAGLAPALLLPPILALPGCDGGGPNDPDDGGSSGDVTYEVAVAFPGISFTNAVDLQAAPDGSGRLFVVEQHGVVRVFDDDPAASAAPVWLDVSGRVKDAGGEEGLLSLAFDPGFASNGYFYLYYTAPPAGVGASRGTLSRFRASPPGASAADPASEVVILRVVEPFSNHNGGQIVLGADGFLYLSLGDGGSGGDPEDNGQDRTTLLGSVLRIDVSALPYTVPADNPFVGNAQGWREEIWAYGLRNPWRMAFDAETGRMWTADVGQNTWEEVDLLEAGGNYGWDCREGMHEYDGDRSPVCASAGELTEPLAEYGRSLGQSVTGGYVVRGAGLPSLAGRYVYGDYVSGRIWALAYDAGSGSATVEELLDTSLNISSFGLDAAGELYVVEHGSGGRIHRLREGGE